MFGLGRQDKAGIVGVPTVFVVIVVIDPGNQSIAQVADEWQRDLLETARLCASESHIEHNDAPFKVTGLRKLARGSDGEAREEQVRLAQWMGTIEPTVGPVKRRAANPIHSLVSPGGWRTPG